MDWGHMDGWGGWLTAMLMMLIFWGGLAGLAILIVTLLRPSTGRHADDAERILAERLARGEINVEEYQQRRQALRR